MNPFQAIVTALGQLWSAFTQWLGGTLQSLWSGFVSMVEFFSAWAISFFVNLLDTLIGGTLEALTVIVSWFPLLEGELAAPTITVPDWIATANRYVPIVEGVGFGATWSAVFGAIFVYKLAKFVRGGG